MNTKSCWTTFNINLPQSTSFMKMFMETGLPDKTQDPPMPRQAGFQQANSTGA